MAILWQNHLAGTMPPPRGGDTLSRSEEETEAQQSWVPHPSGQGPDPESTNVSTHNKGPQGPHLS